MYIHIYIHTCIHTNSRIHIRFASALSVLGTQNEKLVRAMGVTVLPDGLFGKVLQIIFTPPEAAIKLCIIDSNEDMRVSAALVGENLLTFRPANLSMDELRTVNVVRKIVSDAISGKTSAYSEARIHPIITRLMQVYTYECAVCCV
jgi:hypothetical protein